MPPRPPAVTNPVIIGPHLTIIITTEIEKKIGSIEVAAVVTEVTANDTTLECNAKLEIKTKPIVANQ